MKCRVSEHLLRSKFIKLKTISHANALIKGLMFASCADLMRKKLRPSFALK